MPHRNARRTTAKLVARLRLSKASRTLFCGEVTRRKALYLGTEETGGGSIYVVASVLAVTVVAALA